MIERLTTHYQQQISGNGDSRYVGGTGGYGYGDGDGFGNGIWSYIGQPDGYGFGGMGNQRGGGTGGWDYVRYTEAELIARLIALGKTRVPKPA